MGYQIEDVVLADGVTQARQTGTGAVDQQPEALRDAGERLARAGAPGAAMAMLVDGGSQRVTSVALVNSDRGDAGMEMAFALGETVVGLE
jgi:hypothetical protein